MTNDPVEELRATQTFDLQTSSDMLHKLEREKDRLLSATKRTDVADHAFNAAVTAWQLVDWVARDIWIERNTPRSEDTSADKTVDLPIEGATVDELVASLRDYVKNQCPDLAICQTFANASKHATPNQHSLPGTAHVVGVGPASNAIAEDGSLDWSKIDFEGMEHSVVVHIGGEGETFETFDLNEVIATVWLFWHQLIYQHGIG